MCVCVCPYYRTVCIFIVFLSPVRCHRFFQIFTSNQRCNYTNHKEVILCSTMQFFRSWWTGGLQATVSWYVFFWRESPVLMFHLMFWCYLEGVGYMFVFIFVVYSSLNIHIYIYIVAFLHGDQISFILFDLQAGCKGEQVVGNWIFIVYLDYWGCVADFATLICRLP